jgi:hypothetical protein
MGGPLCRRNEENRMTRYVKTWLTLLITSTAGVISTTAAEAPVQLPDVVVTPLRRAAAETAVPYATAVVDTNALAAQSPRTTPDALRELPSVMVQKTSYGQGSPYLRGFTGFRTLMMIDGVRLNNSAFRDGPNQYWGTVDPWSINRFEAVMGPASVLYGSDAIGGAVNALTLAPPAWTGAADYGGRVAYRGATADQSHQGRLELNGRPTEDFGFVAGVTLKTFDDVRGGDDVGDQPNTGYDESAFDLHADYTLALDTTLTLVHQQVAQDDAWRTHRTVYGIDWEGLKHGDDQRHVFDQDRTLTYLRLQARDRGAAVDGYSLTLSRHEQGEDLDRLRGDGRRDLNGFEVVTWGAVLELESQTPVGHLVYGVDYYRDEVDSYSRRYAADGALSKTDEMQGPVADDATYGLLGVFAQDTVELAGGAVAAHAGCALHARCELDADKRVRRRPATRLRMTGMPSSARCARWPRWAMDKQHARLRGRLAGLPRPQPVRPDPARHRAQQRRSRPRWMTSIPERVRQLGAGRPLPRRAPGRGCRLVLHRHRGPDRAPAHRCGRGRVAGSHQGKCQRGFRAGPGTGRAVPAGRRLVGPLRGVVDGGRGRGVSDLRAGLGDTCRWADRCR